jgi:hypothetical protein
VAYAKYRLEYYQTLINQRLKLRTLTWISKESGNDNTFSRLRTNKITLMNKSSCSNMRDDRQRKRLAVEKMNKVKADTFIT